MRPDFDNLPDISARHNLVHMRAFDPLFTVSDTAPTDGQGNQGGVVINRNTNQTVFNIYIDGVWYNMKWDGDGNFYCTILEDADYDTKIQVEEATDEDIIRFDTGNRAGGTTGERATIDYNGIALTSGLSLTFDGRTGSTSMQYNSGSGYLEIQILGDMRIMM
jgi:hypothetical protein